MPRNQRTPGSSNQSTPTQIGNAEANFHSSRFVLYNFISSLSGENINYPDDFRQAVQDYELSIRRNHSRRQNNQDIRATEASMIGCITFLCQYFNTQDQHSNPLDQSIIPLFGSALNIASAYRRTLDGRSTNFDACVSTMPWLALGLGQIALANFNSDHVNSNQERLLIGAIFASGTNYCHATYANLLSDHREIRKRYMEIVYSKGLDNPYDSKSQGQVPEQLSMNPNSANKAPSTVVDLTNQEPSKQSGLADGKMRRRVADR